MGARGRNETLGPGRGRGEVGAVAPERRSFVSVGQRGGASGGREGAERDARPRTGAGRSGCGGAGAEEFRVSRAAGRRFGWARGGGTRRSAPDGGGAKWVRWRRSGGVSCQSGSGEALRVGGRGRNETLGPGRGRGEVGAVAPERRSFVSVGQRGGASDGREGAERDARPRTGAGRSGCGGAGAEEFRVSRAAGRRFGWARGGRNETLGPGTAPGRRGGAQWVRRRRSGGDSRGPSGCGEALREGRGARWRRTRRAPDETRGGWRPGEGGVRAGPPTRGRGWAGGAGASRSRAGTPSRSRAPPGRRAANRRSGARAGARRRRTRREPRGRDGRRGSRCS